jgi:hypothetical protein
MAMSSKTVKKLLTVNVFKHDGLTYLTVSCQNTKESLTVDC